MQNFEEVPTFRELYYGKFRALLIKSWISAENELTHVLRQSVSAPSWKITYENVASLKSYGKSNTSDFVLSLWEKTRWGSASSDQFIILPFCSILPLIYFST